MTPAIRKALLGLHRWGALLFALPAIAIALSGAMLVIRPEAAGRLGPMDAPAGAWERAAAAARKADPGAGSVEIAPRGDRIDVMLDGKWGRTLEVDPRDGRVLADERARPMAFAFLFRLHTRFLAGPWAEWVAVLAGLVLLVSAVTGIALAWPVNARAWKFVLRLRARDGWRAFATDLHRVLGMAAMPLLALNAITGLVLVFAGPVSSLVTAIASPAAAPAVPAAVSAPCSPCTLDALAAHAESLVPGARAVRVVAKSPEDPVLVRLRRTGDNETQGMHRVWLDSASGQVTRLVPLEHAQAGAAVFDWIYPLHTGRWFGIAWCVALALAGGVPLVAFATGLALWTARRRRPGRRPGPDGG